MNRPPLKDVAALAGVSEPTVSRVLNGRIGVAESTRHRVIAALETLGYRDVPEPRAVRRNVVGIICGDFLNPVFATFVHHISTDLGRKGYLTTVAVTDRDLVTEERCIAELVDTSVDGAIFIGGRHAEVDGDLTHYCDLAASGFASVFVNGHDTGIHAPHVRCDEQAAARRAVDHLIGLGHTAIGCILGSSRFIPTRRFVDGYRQALGAAGIDEPDEAIVETAFTLEGGRAGATRLIERGITAVIAGNDLMALGASLAAAAHGPLAIIGYDGTDMTAFTSPALTTVRQPFEDMSQLISDAIVSEIDGSHRFRDHYVFEPQLMVRESSPSFNAAITARN